MNHYTGLAVKYLKQNKNRSILTIIGATLTVMVLYALLNTGVGYLLQVRTDLRKQQNYEIVMLTETEEQINALLSDTDIEDAYVGPYYSYHNGIGEQYDNALYINTGNPYRIDSISERLSTDYGVKAEIHNELAWTYLQGSEGSFIVVLIYFSVLVSFIFAIIGVGIIRNSIQLSMFENIRDYGNLRCIGCSKGELKTIIYMQGMILEIIGIGLGTILGTAVTLILSGILSAKDVFYFQGGFHILPLLLILATFMVDLYFAMRENAKLVTNMSPVSAIRGEYRIKREKIKLREKNLFRILIVKLFGVNGDYAFKSLMRNPGRFIRTVGAMVFGIAGFMAIAAIASTLLAQAKREMKEFGYYQLYYNNQLDLGETISQVEATLPSANTLQEISELPDIAEAKLAYSARSMTYDREEWNLHYSEEYRQSNMGAGIESVNTRVEEYLSAPEGEEDVCYLPSVIGVSCIGYDEADIARCKNTLIEGTTELSENGILLVNRETVVAPGVDEESAWESDNNYIDIPIFDYKVGDEIRIIDIAGMHNRLAPKLTEYREKYGKLMEQCEDEQELGEVEREYYVKVSELMRDVYKEMAEEGCYKTYVVEGIIEKDPNIENLVFLGEAVFIMRQDTFFELSGLDATQPTGMRYHIDRMPKNRRLFKYFGENVEDTTGLTEYIPGGNSFCETSWFGYTIEMYQEMLKYMYAAALIVLFVLTLAMINSVNAISSNLNLRSREFAQLRVIGMSKKQLIKTVMLEGIITTIAASVLGIIMGVVLSFLCIQTIGFAIGIRFTAPILFGVFVIIVSCLVECAAIYIPLKQLGNDLVKDLKAGGD